MLRTFADNKHLMTGPKGNSEFCLPETLNVKVEGKLEKTAKKSFGLRRLGHKFAAASGTTT